MSIISYNELVFIGRIVLALVLGALVGLEREIHNKSAGIRTYGAVSMGACAFAIISFSVFDVMDPTRIAAQIVSGIGFLGAGVIWQAEKKTKGLTTAATLWVSASIGMGIAYGFYWLGLTITLLNIGLLSLHHAPFWPKIPWVKQSGRLPED